MTLSAFHAKTALVTGAASGIGKGLAQVLAGAGAKVALADIQRDECRALAEELPGAMAVTNGDVGSAENAAAMIEETQAAFGPIDLVCANAGVSAFGALADQPWDQIDWQFQVNVFGTLHVARAAIAAMRAHGTPGHVLITGSENSLSVPDAVKDMTLGAYLASKHAVLGIADMLRHEMAPEGIGVSLLCPGPSPTRLMSALRRRPGAYGGPGDLVVPEADPAVLADLAGQQLAPEAVATLALDGVARGDFYILTHPHMRSDVQRRYNEILSAFDPR